MLTGQLAPYWGKLLDETNGGYFGYVGFDGTVDETAEKGSILNSRILWFFSSAALALSDATLLQNATHAFRFLMQHCWDEQNAGVYWSVTAKGELLDTTKHTYAQAFALYALSAYYKASGDEKALQLAKKLYQIIEQNCRIGQQYGEAYDINFAPVSNEKLSENGVEAAHTMNTLLHVFEAYAGLYQVAPSKQVEQSMRHILQVFLTQVYAPQNGQLSVFFDANMQSIIDLQSYGHDIEAAWLLDWGTALLDDAALSVQVSKMTTALTKSVYQKAYHSGTVWNEREKGKNDKTSIWWVQAESVLGFWNEYQKSDDETFAIAAESVFATLQKQQIAPNGEWYWLLTETGEPVAGYPLVSPWKCPYHNGRMCIELLRRCQNVAPKL